MLDAQAAVAAAGTPAQPRALIFTTPAQPLPSTSITVDGSTSLGGSGSNITAYLWSLPSNGGIANLQLPTNGSTATITTTGEGTFTVRLRVTDANNVTDTRDMVVSATTPPAQHPGNSNNGSSGGGSLSWPWLLALWIAVAALRPRRGL
jgi:serine protease